MNDLTERARAFPTRHAFRHELRADGRESLAHMLMMPELGLAGFVYPTMRATGEVKGRACLFGPALDEPVSEEATAAPTPGMDFDRWEAGPLTMRVRAPHERVDIAWAGPRIGVEGQFEALHPPYAFSLHPGGNPAYYGDDRTEQHGRLTATLRVDDRRMTHDGFLVRDHSWGPRIWGLNQHHKWIHAVTPECSVHVFEMQSFGRVHRRGFVWARGALSHVAAVDQAIDYDDTMMQREYRARITDEDGRVVELTARTFASIQLRWDPEVYLNEAAAEVELDGRPGTGWLEFCWNRRYFDTAAPYVSRYGGE